MPSVLDVTLSPMAAAWSDGAHLLLARDVVVGGERYVQGLVLDLAATQQLLERRAIGGSLLSEFAVLQWSGAPNPWGDYPQHFTHDFDPPFGALHTTIWLQALPAEGRSSVAYIAGLAFALGLVGLLGIVAVARMVGVTVAFAERRNNFVAAVSHELKTPLTAIRMYAEMLRDDMVPGEERKHDYYEIITAQGCRRSRVSKCDEKHAEHGPDRARQGTQTGDHGDVQGRRAAVQAVSGQRFVQGLADSDGV